MRKVPHAPAVCLLGFFALLCSLPSWAAERFVSAAGRFKVEFPYGQPAESTRELNSELGDLKLNIVSAANPDDSVAYLVSYVDYPAERVRRRGAEVLKSAVDGLVGEEGKVQRAEDIKVRKMAVRRVLFTRGPFSIQAWIFLSGPRLYQLVAISRGMAAKPEHVQGFFDSFVLMDDEGGRR